MESRIGQIVVGYDGSESAGAAVDWAATEAAASGRSLTVVHLVDYWSLVPGPVDLSPWSEPDSDGVGRVAREGATRAGRLAGPVTVQALTQVARVAPTLIEMSQQAELIVVGTRGHGNLAGLALGSIAFAVSAHAHCPVVVVRGESTQTPGPECPVVVGFDGSPGSEGALRYAADTAARAQAPLIVTTVYRPLSTQGFTETLYYGYGGNEVTAKEASVEAHQIALKIAADADKRARQWHPRLDVRQQVVSGATVGQLCTTAHRAGLLVVGSRGLGGFAGLVLGSIGHGVIHDAPCPVVVVHGPPPETTGDQAADSDVSAPETMGGAR